MEFKLILAPGAQFKSIGLRREDEIEWATAQGILSNICETLSETTQTRFIVAGFNVNWPVTVDWDLCCLLEDLPGAIKAIVPKEPFNIDFYEQGIERYISFEPQGDKYVAACLCLTTKESPIHKEIEEIDRVVLKNMLAAIRDDLMAYLRDVYPPIAENAELNAFLYS